MKFDREVLKGILKTIILAVLADGSSHAYGLRKKIQEKSLDVFSITEGTLYPTLHKLEEDGLIQSEQIESTHGRIIRNYSLTAKGNKILEESKREWYFLSRAMKLVLEPGGPPPLN